MAVPPTPRPGAVPLVKSIASSIADAVIQAVIRRLEQTIRALEERVATLEAEPDVVGGGGALTDGDYGDITVSGGGTAMAIDAGVVSTAKLGVDITAAGKALLDDATAADQRTTLGLGSAATQASSAFAAASHTHAQSDVTNLVTDLAGKAPLSHTHAAGDITSGTMATARLGSGAANATTFLRGDQTWAVPAGGGASWSTATLDMGSTPKREHAITVVDGAITPSSKLIVVWGTTTDADINTPDFEVITFAGRPGSGIGTVIFSSPTPIAGLIKISYQVV